MGHEGSKRPLTHAHITASNHALYGDYMTGDGKHCHKTAWGCIVLAYSVIAWGMFATRGQWRRRASDSDETPPIDLLLLYCVRSYYSIFSIFSLSIS